MDKEKEQAISNAIEVMINVPYDVTERERTEDVRQQAAEIRNKERPEGRYTIGDAIILLRAGTGEFIRLGEAIWNGELKSYAPGSNKKIITKGNNPKDWTSYDDTAEVYWNDLNDLLAKEYPRVDYKFPEPTAPTAKVEGEADTPPAPAEVEAVKCGITKQQVINAFEGLHFDRDQWSKYLSDTPNWLLECRLTPGVQGRRTSATWNPVLIAAALYGDEGKKIAIKKLDAVFFRLNDWTDEWREVSASFRD